MGLHSNGVYAPSECTKHTSSIAATQAETDAMGPSESDMVKERLKAHCSFLNDLWLSLQRTCLHRPRCPNLSRADRCHTRCRFGPKFAKGRVTRVYDVLALCRPPRAF
jgi:hypothetical protein